MQKLKIILPTVLFLIAAIADVSAVIVENETIRLVSKPMLITLLALVYLVSVSKPNFWFVLGLFFCFLGDVFLLFNGTNFFMLGLAAFLLGHVVYIKVASSFLPSHLTFKIVTSALPFVFFLVLLLYIIQNNLGELLFPVVVYGVTISSFGTVALLNYREEKSIENTWLFIGALTFIVSDSLLALNKFYEPSRIFEISIMITYIVAQFLICKAMIVKTNTH
ncbi:MAG: lysoplasmalogenase [Flavobacteriaceae bacterium]|nr:lysoplasmalogenase [Flavobacteriaceae bacterium]